MAGLIKRGKHYYMVFRLGGREQRLSLNTVSQQVAKELVRQFESAVACGDAAPLPTKTPVAEVLSAYARHIRATKTAKSAQTDVYYLRSVFGPICPELEITSRRVSERCQKRPASGEADLRRRPLRVEARCFEHITTAHLSKFISRSVASRSLAPKTANRYREILTRLFNWAMMEGGVRMPRDHNPAAAVSRYRENAPDIRFLTLPQVETQLRALEGQPQLQAMVALYIYAGLRREEALWLQMADLDLAAGEHGVIRVRAKTVDEQFWEPKTKRNRAVPISRTLRSYLDRYVPRLVPGNWYFPSPHGLRYEPDNFSQDLARAQRRLGLPWTCLDFRHTFGSQLAMKGESLYKISALMGNSPEICRRHYAAIVPEALTDTVEFPEAPKVGAPVAAARRQLA